VLLTKIIHLIPKPLVGLLEVKQPRLQLSPMSNARLNTENKLKVMTQPGELYISPSLHHLTPSGNIFIALKESINILLHQ
jgi:hypothetical protein